MAHSAYDVTEIYTKGDSNRNLDSIVDGKLSRIRHMRPPVFREEWEVWIKGEKYATADSLDEAYRKMDEGLAERRQLEEASRRRRAAQPQPTPATQAPTSQPARLRRFLIIVGLVFVIVVIVLGSIVFLVTSPHPLYTYTGHSGSVNAVAWSPDGKLIASASDDKTVRIWDVATGDTILTYTGHSGAVTTLAWSPNGKYIASSGPDGMQVWTAKDGKKVFTFGPAKAISWSPDNKHLAWASTGGTVFIGELGSHNSIMPNDGNVSINAVSWSPNGKYIAYGGDAGTILWDPQTNETVRTIQPYELYGGIIDSVLSIAWSHDSNNIAVGYQYEVGGFTVNPVIGKTIFNYVDDGGGSSDVFSVAWSPDGKYVAFGNDFIKVRKIADGSTVVTYHGHGSIYLGHFSTGTVTSVAYSPDGTRIASAGTDKTVQIWQAQTS